jgi:hypothetical protein
MHGEHTREPQSPLRSVADREPLTDKCYVWPQLKSRRASGLLHSLGSMDIDRDVIGVMLDRDGKPYLKLGQVSTCKRIHVEALKPLRGGGDCGKSISVWENFDGLLVWREWAISAFRWMLIINGERFRMTLTLQSNVSSFTIPERTASGGQRRPSSRSTAVDRCSPCTCVPPSTRTRYNYFGTEILYSSKGVVSTAIRKSSSAAFGLIPPSRSLSIWNHLPIPTRTVC